MATVHSFKEYVTKTFDDQFWQMAEVYIRDHFEELDIKLRRIHKAGELEITDVAVEHVWAYDLQGMEIGLDVALSVNIIIAEADYHYDDYDDKTIWLMVKCRGNIDRRLEDFSVSEISLYTKRNRKQRDLDDSLVPYISHDQLEDEAHDFLERNYPEALRLTPPGEPPIPVDPFLLSEKLNLKVELRRIREDASVFGQIFFETAETRIYDEKTKTEKLVFVERRTILADPQMYFLRNHGSVNNTIVHECVHWDKHRKAFALAKLYNSDISSISCKIIGGALSPIDQIATEFMERQANQLAPRIQMPAVPFKTKANEYIRKFLRERNANHVIDIMEAVILQLKVDFGVSKQAAKIRLVELGFEEAIGTFTYLDGHYVKPHGFSKGRIKHNQTFSLSAQDAAIQRMVNPELKDRAANGEYLFVDNHFVYNAPLYVGYGEMGNLELTDYARAHMDECCLLFDMTISSKIGTSYHTACFLNREQSDITFEIKFHNGYENAPQERQVVYRKKQQAEWMDIRRQMTDDPEQCMELLLDWRDMKYTELGKAIKRDPKTISRTVHRKTSPDVTTAALICFGLHLPPILSEKLMDVLGCTLSPIEPAHQWIKEALQLKYPEPLWAVREFLSQYEVEL